MLFARLALKYQFAFKAIAIDGDNNPIADTLSRKNDLKRNLIYSHAKKQFNIPAKIASKIINSTCVNKFTLYPHF